jgi:hypothetical protein
VTTEDVEVAISWTLITRLITSGSAVVAVLQGS